MLTETLILLSFFSSKIFLVFPATAQVFPYNKSVNRYLSEDCEPLMNPDWHAFVRSEGPRLFRYFLARFDAPTADDLTQEVLIRLVRKYRSGGVDPSRGNLNALSFGIAHNIAREKYRQNHRSLEDAQGQGLENFEIASESKLSDQILSQSQEMKRLKEAIALLSPAEQEVISLLVSRDLPLPEIASILDLPLNTVKSHVHRAKAKIREHLATETSTRRENQ